MRRGNAAILHEGGTTSAIAPYFYFCGNALSEKFDNVYAIKKGWEYLSDSLMLEEGVHYFDFSKMKIDPKGRKNPLGTSRACPVETQSTRTTIESTG
jgi:hypothetical protein